MKNILNQKIEDIIEKADVASAFEYSDDVKFTKKGSSIKEQAEKRLVEYSMKLKNVSSTMQSLREFINEAPQEEAYVNEDTLKICPFCGKRYGNIYEKFSSEAIPIGTVNGIDEVKNSKIRYNELINSCDDICIDIVSLKTIINNIEVNKEYILNFKQLKSLNY